LTVQRFGFIALHSLQVRALTRFAAVQRFDRTCNDLVSYYFFLGVFCRLAFCSADGACGGACGTLALNLFSIAMACSAVSMS
jgi:hypothetical protein